jgi:hypothetical protein
MQTVGMGGEVPNFTRLHSLSLLCSQNFLKLGFQNLRGRGNGLLLEIVDTLTGYRASIKRPFYVLLTLHIPICM